MKIRTQFILTLLFFGILLIGMVASLLATNQQVDQLREQEEIARRLEQGANELNYLSGDYLMYGESQQRTRWEARFASFSADLVKLKPLNIEQQAIVSHMISDQKRLRALFTDVVSTLERSAQSSGGSLDPAFTQVSWSRMEVQSQSIAFEAALLSQQLREEAERLRQLNFALIFILIGIFGAYLLTNYYLIDQRTLRSIAQLQAGTQIIGSGDLDFTIAVKRMDEIGELSVAFNQMTANLKEVTASKADLEREMAERKRAQEALQDANEELQVSAEELRAQNDELRRIQSALQDVNAELETTAEELRVQNDELLSTQSALRESEARYRNLVEFAPVGIYEIDLASRNLISVNDVVASVTGYTHEELLSMDALDLLEGEHKWLFVDRIKKLMEGQEVPEVVEYQIRMKSGELRWALLNVNFTQENGIPVRARVTATDITQRKLAEEALREVNDKLQEQAVELEMQAQELQAQKNQLIIANENLGLSEELANQRRMEIEAVNKELRVARLAALNLMEDALSAQEELQQINLRLREGEQRLNRAQEIAHLGSWELDLINNQLTWSDEVYRIFGLQPQQFGATYEAFLEAVHPDDRAAVDAAYSGSIREGRDQYEIEHRVVRQSSGEIRVVHEKCEHLRNKDGQITCSIGMVHDITERKQAEEQLRYQAALLSNVNDAIIASDAQYRLTAWNAAAESLYGWKEEEVIGCNGLEIIRTEWPEVDAQEMRLIISETGRWRGEATQMRKDGRRFPVEVSSIVLRDASGQISGYISVNRDITERKRAEEALRESEAKYRNLFENMTEEVHFWQLVYDKAGRIQTWRLVDANPPTLKTWNRKTVDEIKGKTTDEIFGPGATEHYMPVVQKIMTEGIPYSFEDYFSNLDKHFRFTSVPLGDHFITTGADITIIKKAEEALRRSRDELELRVEERTKQLAAANTDLVREITERKEIERQLRIQTTAMEAAANGIMITDHRGNIQWTNPALTQISGYDLQDLIGQSTRIFRSGQHDAAYYHQMWNTILSGHVWRGETTNRRKDGEIYIEEQTITPVRDDSGQIQHFIAIKQDITERKRAEKELELISAEREALIQEEREQRQFAEALVQAVLVLNKSLKLDEVLSHILEQIQEVIPYELANITLLEGETFYDASHRGELGWPVARYSVENRFPVSDFPLFGKMIETSQPLLIEDTRSDAEWVIVRGLEWSRSFLSTPLLVEGQVIGFVNLFSSKRAFFTQAMRSRLAVFAAQATVAIQNAWLFEQVRASTERLQSLSRRLVEIQENERLYISRELHDEAGQVLTSLLVDLRLLEKNISKPKILQKIVTEMESSLNGVIENLHRIAMALRPASLDHVGLVAALRQHVESIGEKNGLHIGFTASGVVERLPANIETVLYRIVQEALTNIVRHAHATRVDVVLTVRDGKLIVIIEDDGIGFDPEVASTGNHLGLFGMRERTEMINGKLMIESAPGKGTTIMMEVGYADTIGDRR